MAICSPCPRFCYCLACLHGDKEKVVFFLFMYENWLGCHSYPVWKDDDGHDHEFEMIASNMFLVWPAWLGLDVLGYFKV